jgi:hypothetical protein
MNPPIETSRYLALVNNRKLPLTPVQAAVIARHEMAEMLRIQSKRKHTEPGQVDMFNLDP